MADEIFSENLSEHGQQWCSAVASRIALEHWHQVISASAWDESASDNGLHERLVLLSGACILCGSVLALDPNQKTKNLAQHASHYIRTTTALASNTEVYVSRAIAANAAATGSKANFEDYCQRAIKAGPLDPQFIAMVKERKPAQVLCAPWIGSIHSEGRAHRERDEILLLDNDPRFSFFARWYKQLKQGAPLHWELAKRVTHIDIEIWDSGLTEVAEAIAEVERAWLATKGSQVEEVYADPADGRYLVREKTIDPDLMLSGLIENLERYLVRAARRHNISGFSDLGVAYEILSDTILYCREDPHGVLTNISIARKTIAANLTNGTYQIEESLNALLLFIERAETQLCADHPDVRQSYDRFVEQRVRQLNDQQRLSIAEGFRDLSSNVARDRLASDYANHAKLLETNSGHEAQADAIKVSGGRTGKIAVDLAEKVKTADGSALNKATGMLMRVQKVVELLTNLL